MGDILGVILRTENTARKPKNLVTVLCIKLHERGCVSLL